MNVTYQGYRQWLHVWMAKRTSTYHSSCIVVCTAWRTPVKQIAWTMLVKYEIFVSCNKSIYFNGTAHTMKQETYVSWNLLIVLRVEMLCNFRRCCYFFHWFKWKEYNKLLEICFPNMHWAANMLHVIYLWNIFHAICFIGVCRT